VGAITGASKEAQLEAYSKAMELQLAFNNEVRTDAEEDSRRNKIRMREVNEMYEKQKAETFDLTRDMTRQYKDMQEELLHKINSLEGTIQELKDELETDRASFQNTLRKKDQTIASHEKTIDELKNKMEGMAEDFGDMLKKTLNKMKERIELNSGGYEEQAVPIQKRLEEFQMPKN
jgi:predicted RNase H-like nuclease (RuvC/YqgF family)